MTRLRGAGPAWPGRCGAAAAGILADRALGEPPLGAAHPVAVFGRTMAALEVRAHRDRRGPGVAFAAAGAGLGVGAGAALGPSPAATAAATALAVAGRALHGAAGEVGDALAAGDLDRARALLPALVGRDPAGLDAAGVAAAVVESVAENTVDAVVAPALWAALAGAPGALGHRAVDTLDSMVGYRDARHRRFGWGAARLDDVAAWVPARATAALVALAAPGAAPAVWRAVRTQAPAHPSPNAGVAEAAFAAALGIRLGGTANRYVGSDGDVVVDGRPALGWGPSPGAGDIGRAVALSARVGSLLALGLGGAAVAGAVGGRWRVRTRVTGGTR